MTFLGVPGRKMKDLKGEGVQVCCSSNDAAPDAGHGARGYGHVYPDGF